MSDKPSFFSEFKRRHVDKVALVYAVVAWLLIEIAWIVLPTFDAPAWILKAFIILLLLGFIFAFTISWSFEMTPEGMKRTADVSPGEVLPRWSRRRFGAFVVGVAVIAAALLIYQFFKPATAPATDHSAATKSMPQKSIAVLPFLNLSADKNDEYLSEGMTEELLNVLTKVKSLHVPGRSSSFAFKGKNRTRLIFMPEPYPCYPFNPWFFSDFQKIVVSPGAKE